MQCLQGCLGVEGVFLACFSGGLFLFWKGPSEVVKKLSFVILNERSDMKNLIILRFFPRFSAGSE